MNLACSNIAWSPDNRLAAYAILRELGFRGLEIAPGLFFHDAPDAFAPPEAHARAAISEVEDAGLRLVSMQALLFGVEGAKLFGDRESRERFHTGMLRAITLAGRFHIRNLVFGSPVQRAVPHWMRIEDAESRAIDVFRRLGDAATAAGTRICIEPNPEEYGTNFLNTAAQTLEFVRKAGHPGIAFILDTGAAHMNSEFDRIGTIIGEALSALHHVHISRPRLAPAPATAGEAARVLRALDEAGYDGWVSIEMKQSADGLGNLREAAWKLSLASNLARAA